MQWNNGEYEWLRGTEERKKMEKRKEMRLDEVVLNLKGSIGSTAVQDGSFSRVQIPQAQCSAASEEQRNVGLSTYQFTLTHTRKKKTHKKTN